MQTRSDIAIASRPAQRAEHYLITAILDGRFPPDTPLPSERLLAQQIGVARPPLRETLQRLASQGWLTIAHGKPTVVNDYWQSGGLGLLSTLARYIETLPDDFVTRLLEVRSRLLPAMAAQSARRAPKELLALLDKAEGLVDEVGAFVDYDWRLQLFLATQTGNPIYRLIFNDFERMFEALGTAYFALPRTRGASRTFYRDLATAIRTGNPAIETVVAAAMEQSVILWQELTT